MFQNLIKPFYSFSIFKIVIFKIQTITRGFNIITEIKLTYGHTFIEIAFVNKFLRLENGLLRCYIVYAVTGKHFKLSNMIPNYHRN